MSEVRGRSREDPMPEGQRPKGATPCPRLWGRPRGDTQHPRSGVVTRRVTLHPRSGAAAARRYPTPEARGGGWEDQPHVQGAVAAWAQEGLEELSHVEGQEGRR